MTLLATRTRQPPNPTRLSSSPLARGLVYAVADLTAPFEAAAGRRLTYTDSGTAPSLSSAGNANAIRIAGSGFRSLTDPAGALRIFSGPMTVAMFARVSALDVSWGALWTIKDASSANAIWACQRSGSSGDINMEITGGAGCSFTGAVAAVANNVPQIIVVSRTGVTASDTASLWAGGSKYTATMSGGAAGTVTSCVLNVGASRWNSSIASGDFGSALVWNRALSDDEVASLRGNPWHVFAPVRRPVYFLGPSAGAGTTIAVPVGAVSVAGYAPTVTATANQTISVPVGAVSLAGYAPTISTSASQTIAVPAGAVTLAGYAPTVTATANQAIAVPAGAVSLTGYAPSVFTTAVTTIAVPAGAVSLAGFAPSVSYTTHAYIDVPKGAVTLTGYAPTVTGGESSIWTPVTTDSAVWSAQNVSAATWTPQ